MSDPPTRRRLCLASASPRRARLLREAGFSFDTVQPAFDDSRHDAAHLPPHLAAPALAFLKAASVADRLDSGIVLGADTLLSVDGERVGKPADEADARRILQRLIGRSHLVISAVCLVDAADRRQRIASDQAEVTVGELEEAELNRYVASGQWRGKAGGYNLAELEGRWDFQVRGDPATVVGLPLRKLTEALRQFAPDVLPQGRADDEPGPPREGV